ncbi:hypothetical protein BDN70DRAFT_936643 [Pholiota conissans]|uniref:Uncharacterized protein n=1 Tax=Pholiota conissans TaxID=109636 RepID=A0A9P5YRB3_9AGAR|nr:hypothetical protein BDN70DRAFT_936643 [Pholiota conissans]
MFDLTICSSTEIAATAAFYAKTIMENKNAMDAVIESLHTTGVSRINYSRSVALLARRVQLYLEFVDSELSQKFRKTLVETVIDIYFEFWAGLIGYTSTKATHQSEALSSANAIALCGFMGDLRYAGMITFTIFELCLSYLIHRIKELELEGILSQLATIAHTPWGFWSDVVDRRLDLDHALMASVCASDSEDGSSDDSRVSLESSVSSVEYSRPVKMPELQHPCPLKKHYRVINQGFALRERRRDSFLEQFYSTKLSPIFYWDSV